MAKMWFIDVDKSHQFGCYGERGLMSYFMFVQLPSELPEFLRSLQFPNDVPHPFASQKEPIKKSVIFSELSFGNEGFGSPDGAIYVEWPLPTMIYIEVKANESYAKSCDRKNAYNSTIRGQLELRWRMTELYRQGKITEYRGAKYIQETAEFKAIYKAEDAFYGHEDRQDETWPGSWRRLKIVEGVKAFLDLLARCEERVYFCAITKDEQNPLDTINSGLRPRCGHVDWLESRRHFCWQPVTRILNATPSECREGEQL